MNYSDLRKVNSDINLLPYVPEVVEDWSSITITGGDCDSYATRKFEELTKIGWPASVLRLATCYTETNEMHAVLLADHNEQTWVLDNRYPLPMEFQALPYAWILIQIAGTQQWEGVSKYEPTK